MGWELDRLSAAEWDCEGRTGVPLLFKRKAYPMKSRTVQAATKKPVKSAMRAAGMA